MLAIARQHARSCDRRGMLAMGLLGPFESPVKSKLEALGYLIVVHEREGVYCATAYCLKN